MNYSWKWLHYFLGFAVIKVFIIWSISEKIARIDCLYMLVNRISCNICVLLLYVHLMNVTAFSVQCHSTHAVLSSRTYNHIARGFFCRVGGMRYQSVAQEVSHWGPHFISFFVIFRKIHAASCKSGDCKIASCANEFAPFVYHIRCFRWPHSWQM